MGADIVSKDQSLNEERASTQKLQAEAMELKSQVLDLEQSNSAFEKEVENASAEKD